jgi:hypothetical protein
MKKPSHTSCLVLPVLLAATLSACGGGSSSSDTQVAVNPALPTNPANPAHPVTPPAAGSDTGSVSAPFVQGLSTRYLLLAVASQSYGALSSVTQDSAGALSEISGVSFSGTPAITRDISGDAASAQGRWFTGTITRSSGATVMSGNNASAHYSVYNEVAVLPFTGAFQCDAGKFTAPSYTGGASVQPDGYFGTASGSATLSFGSAGAALAMTVDATAGGSNGKASGTGTISSPAMTAISGGFLGGSSGMLLALGDGGTGTYLVTGGYKVVLANGANYQGVATFRCS